MGENDEIVREFLLESTENLDQLDRDLVELEQNPSSKEILSSIFRSIHTIKGTTGFFGFSKLESLTHSGEGLLSRLRDGKLSLTPEITSALLNMVDAVREMLAAIDSTGQDGDSDYATLIEALRKLQEARIDPAAPNAKPESEAEGQPTKPLQPDAPLPLGQILIRSGHVSEAEVEAALKSQRAGDPRHLGEILVEQGAVASHVIRAAMEEQAKVQASLLAGNAIRVEVEQLQKLMNLAGELALTRDQIMRFSASQQSLFLLNLSQRLNFITTEMQATLMNTRMQAIGSLWTKVARMVRDLAASCGKQARVKMEGKDIELDRAIIEAIRDPLTHIVRNAVDHGIEPPAKRAEAGKSPEGQVSLRAYREDGLVSLEVSDDGAGVDLGRVKQTAIERGLVTPEQASSMDGREACKLLFLPGFSTALKVTHVSGRGVGMDVVRTNIERIGGTVEAESKAGQGLTIKMKLPITLATVPALIVACRGERFAIPQGSVLDRIRLEGGEAHRAIATSRGAPVYRLGGRLLALVYLDRELGIHSSPANGARTPGIVNIVILQTDDCQFGLVVDEVRDREEIVIKPLSEEFRHLSVCAGATIMGDGKVGLVLDIPALAQRASIREPCLPPPARRNG